MTKLYIWWGDVCAGSSDVTFTLAINVHTVTCHDLTKFSLREPVVLDLWCLYSCFPLFKRA